MWNCSRKHRASLTLVGTYSLKHSLPHSLVSRKHDIKAPTWCAAITASCWPEASQTQPGSSYGALVTAWLQSKGSQTTPGHELGGLSSAGLCPLDLLAVTSDRSGNPPPMHSVNIPSYPTWNHARPLAWNPCYLEVGGGIKMIWVNKKGHVAKAMREIWVLFLAPPNPGDDNPLFAFFLYLDCKFLKTETVSWYLFIQSVYIGPRDYCND